MYHSANISDEWGGINTPKGEEGYLQKDAWKSVQDELEPHREYDESIGDQRIPSTDRTDSVLLR